MRRRSAASASCARLSSFSFTSIRCHAVVHSFAETISGFIANSCLLPLLSARAASLRQAPIVVSAQLHHAVPERSRLLAAHARHQHIKMRMPAGGNAEHGLAVGQTAMDQSQQHVAAMLLQLDRNFAAAIPGEGDPARLIERGDPAVHAVLLTKTI